MSIGSFIAGLVVGSAATYWGSEKVHDNITNSLAKTEQLMKNEAELNHLCYQQIQKWYFDGSLGTVVNIIQQQKAARDAGLNFQASANDPNLPNFQPNR